MAYSGIKDKTAIVTGAGEGIGYAIAEALAKQGAKVVLNDVDAALCEASAREIDAAHPGPLPALCRRCGRCRLH